MNWVDNLIEITYHAAIMGIDGCWINRKDNCSYSCVGPLTFRRGDGVEIILTEQELYADMSPT